MAIHTFLLPLHPQLIGLHMFELYLSLAHQVLVELLAMLACLHLPSGHSALVRAKRRYDRLDRAAVASNVSSTTLNSSAGLCKRQKGVSRVSLKVHPQRL